MTSLLITRFDGRCFDCCTCCSTYQSRDREDLIPGRYLSSVCAWFTHDTPRVNWREIESDRYRWHTDIDVVDVHDDGVVVIIPFIASEGRRSSVVHTTRDSEVDNDTVVQSVRYIPIQHRIWMNR